MARMEDHRIPKQMLFGCLLQPHPAHAIGVKMHQRDRVRKDLKKFGIVEEGWFKNTQDRSAWRC